MDIQLIQHHLLERFSFPIELSLQFFQKSIDQICVGLFLDIYSVPFMYVSILLSLPLLS